MCDLTFHSNITYTMHLKNKTVCKYPQVLNFYGNSRNNHRCHNTSKTYRYLALIADIPLFAENWKTLSLSLSGCSHFGTQDIRETLRFTSVS
jgi:hypothetical protein